MSTHQIHFALQDHPDVFGDPAVAAKFKMFCEHMSLRNNLRLYIRFQDFTENYAYLDPGKASQKTAHSESLELHACLESAAEMMALGLLRGYEGGLIWVHLTPTSVRCERPSAQSTN